MACVVELVRYRVNVDFKMITMTGHCRRNCPDSDGVQLFYVLRDWKVGLTQRLPRSQSLKMPQIPNGVPLTDKCHRCVFLNDSYNVIQLYATNIPTVTFG